MEGVHVVTEASGKLTGCGKGAATGGPPRIFHRTVSAYSATRQESLQSRRVRSVSVRTSASASLEWSEAELKQALTRSRRPDGFLRRRSVDRSRQGLPGNLPRELWGKIFSKVPNEHLPGLAPVSYAFWCAGEDACQRSEPCVEEVAKRLSACERAYFKLDADLLFRRLKGVELKPYDRKSKKIEQLIFNVALSPSREEAMSDALASQFPFETSVSCEETLARIASSEELSQEQKRALLEIAWKYHALETCAEKPPPLEDARRALVGVASTEKARLARDWKSVL